MARTVLLADDSVTAQNMGRRILMDAGYEVVTVNNGSAALKKIHESHPDLIVLDVYMPGYGGLEVCQRLKDSAETARIPVLLSVGKMEPFKADEAKRVRADGHIVKPFEASELLAALTRLEDRIVPQADASNGRRTKSDSGKVENAKPEKKSRLWRGEDPLASADEPLTDRVAYLAEAKKRRAQNDEDSAEVATASPVAAETPATEFSVQESPVPTPDDEVPANEVKAVEAPSIFEASTIEIPAAQLSTTEPSEAEVSAETTAAPTVETPAAEGKAEDSQEWVVGESLFGQPAHGEPELSESVFEKTAFFKTAFGKSEPRAAVPEASENQTASEAAPTVASAVGRVSAARWIAENVALSVEEASIALEAEMQQAQAASPAAANETRIPAQEPVSSSDNAVAQTPTETDGVESAGAAFAAAASASGQSAVSTQPATAESGEAASVPEVEPPSDATAAWANWQQIRDSVMSPQKAAELAESVAAIAQASLQTPEQSTKTKEDVATKLDSASTEIASAGSTAQTTEPPAEDNSINDIVDSVLADLKPRLMQEIAKKLAAKK